jgi:hypothetical protein
MPQTELRGDDKDVVILLLVAERLEHLSPPWPTASGSPDRVRLRASS